MKKCFIIILLPIIFNCCDNLDENTGGDSMLKDSEWESALIDHPNYQPCHYYLTFNENGTGGLYYHVIDTCYNNDTVKFKNGKLLISGSSYRYILSTNYLRVFYPLYNSNDQIIGEFGLLYSKVNIDTINIKYCNEF